MFYRSRQHTSVCRTDEIYSCMIAPVCHFAGRIQQPGRPSPWLHATMFCPDASLVSLFILESNGHTFSYKFPESIVGNLWLNVNCWFYSKAWQVVSMGCSRWREQRHIWHITSMMGAWAKRISVFDFSMITPPPMVEISAHSFPSSLMGATLSRKLSPTCSVCSHTSSICPWISICQSPCPTVMKMYFIIFLTESTSHMSFTPGCFPTKCLLSEEWMNGWNHHILSVHPSSVQVRNMIFLCLSDALPLFLLLSLLADLQNVYAVTRSLLWAFSQASLWPEEHPFFLCCLTPYTALMGQALCPPPLKGYLSLCHFTTCSLIGQKRDSAFSLTLFEVKHTISRTSLSSHSTEYSVFSHWSIYNIQFYTCVFFKLLKLLIYLHKWLF